MTIKGLPFTETHEVSPDGMYYVMKEQYAGPYRAALDKQLGDWYAGISTHCEYSGECCPDFSCCRPELKWNHIRREEFLKAMPEQREQMLMRGLAAITEPNGMSTYAENIQPVVRVLGTKPEGFTSH